MHLFLDTTFGVTVGLLSDEYKWFSYEYSLEKKSSVIIHDLINQVLDKADISIKSLTSVIAVAGPGSYTGMRVSKGVTDILEWQGLDIYSFYQFDVPSLIGIERGVWFSNAFKGEYFIYDFDQEKSSQKLLKKEDAIKKIKDSDIPVFVIRNEEGDDYVETQALIKEHSEELFGKVVGEKLKRSLFYYRDLDQEFSKAKGL